MGICFIGNLILELNTLIRVCHIHCCPSTVVRSLKKVTGHILNPQSRHLAKKCETGRKFAVNQYLQKSPWQISHTRMMFTLYMKHPFFQSLIFPPCDGTNFLHFHQAAVYTRCVMACTSTQFLSLFVFHLHLALYLKYQESKVLQSKYRQLTFSSIVILEMFFMLSMIIFQN